MTLNLHDLKAGQTLQLTIRKMNRWYVFFKNAPGREGYEPVLLDDLQVGIHETHRASQQAWDALRTVLAQQYTIPPEIDLRGVADAAGALGMGNQFRREIERMKR